MSKANKLSNASLTKSDVDTLIENGAIREDYLMLIEGFNAEFSVTEAPASEMKSFKTGEKFEMPRFVFTNDKSRYTVWGSTLLNSLVVKDYEIKTKPIKKAKGLPVYFRDEFLEEHSNLRKVSDLRDDDGGINIYDRYKIVGAIVTKSRVDDTRWSIGPRMYEKGAMFLEYERTRLNDKSINWISEERLIEISKMDKSERTFTSPVGEITLPSFTELKVVGKADEDVRWAKAQFIVEQTW